MNTIDPKAAAPMLDGPHKHLTITQLQERLCELGTIISNTVEEQHRICEELMDRAEMAAGLTDQSKVDWHVVGEAFSDAVCNAEGENPGEKGIARQFQKAGLLVVHRDDVSVLRPT